MLTRITYYQRPQNNVHSLRSSVSRVSSVVLMESTRDQVREYLAEYFGKNFNAN
jgi:hypothetical protein